MGAKGRPEEKALVSGCRPHYLKTRCSPIPHWWKEEPTVPWVEGCEEIFEKKAKCCRDLPQDFRDKAWQAWLHMIEVGCRGFPAQSAWKCLTPVGLMGTERKNAVWRLGEAAEGASCSIWSRREEASWMPGGSELWLATITNPPTGECYGSGSKHWRMVGNHLMTRPPC